MERKHYEELPFGQKHLLNLAIKARKNSYCKYSGFAVGVAILSTKEKIYIGWNVESILFTTTVHAEKNAICRMPKSDRKIKMMAIASPSAGGPCGQCCEDIGEFADPDIIILDICVENNEVVISTLSELLPLSFSNYGKDKVKTQ